MSGQTPRPGMTGPDMPVSDMPDSDMIAGDLRALYQEKVRLWAAKVRNDRRLVHPDMTIDRTSPVCGSSLTLDFICNSGRVAQLGWRARACTLGMASTACFVALAPGRELADILEAGAQLARLLEGEDSAFHDGWSELEMFRAARGYPSRHGSILLPFAIARELQAGMADR